MSEPEDMQPAHPEPAAPPPAPPRRRGRRFLRLGLLAALLLVVGTVILYFWASSESTQNMVRKAMIDRLQQVTGGRVEIASFHWNLLDLSAEAGGVVIHGRESTEEAPLAKVERINARISLFGLWSPRILLRSLEILKPEFHVIVYPDGVTNIPQPRAPRKPGKPVIETLFNLQAGHVSIEQGVLDYENRAAEFDFQNRFTLLDIDARDFSALMRYVPPTGKDPETYHLEAGATDLSVVRGKDKPALGEMQATLDLTRSDAFLRSLRITTKFPATTGRGEEQHTIAVSGSLHDFAHPRWNATATGELDLRLLDPALGYPLNPQGIAHLNLESAGQAGQFRVDGTVHAVNTSYVGTGVVVTGALLDAHVHADPKQLLVSKIAVRLRQGGQIDGEVALTPWLPGKVPGGASIERSGMAGVRATGPVTRPKRPLPPDPNVIEIPVNGKVIANFKDVSLDAILDMVGQPPFQRLGLDTLVNGGTRTDWVKGDQQTINVVAQLALNLPQKPVAGEVPTQGAIDATYTQRDGAVDLRTLVLNTPASRIDAHGHLGAYPLNSPSGFDIDFKSHDLTEFDSVLRDLGLHRYGKTGVAALPVISSGEMDFLHGKWTGSLASPRLAGNFKATQVGLEMLPQKPAPNDPTPVEPKFVHWDSIEGTGSYAPERISVTNGLMKRGNAQIAVDGSLDATPGRVPTFNEDSILHMRVQAGKVGTDDLLPLLGVDLPVHGSLDTQLAIDGPIRSPGGSGWAELTNATAYGEPFSRLRVQGTLANNQVKLASVTISAPSGSVSGSGNYDLKSRRFQVSARGNAIDIAKIRTLHDRGADAGGSLSFTVDGDGTLDDPRLDARANFTGLTVGGEDLGALVFSAHTANKAATYKASTRVEGAEIDLTGQTALSGDYPTQAKLNFSHFDIGGLLKTAHVTGLTGESALAGAITVAGPLAHPAEMHGDARLQDLAVTVAGVHLASQGEVHATLAGGRITLDPLHVTGEDTDLHVQGNLSLKDKQQLDLAASGSINMKLAETVDSDLTASGTTTFQVEAHGTVSNPDLRGRIDFQNASLSLEDVPNGLSQLHGTLEFNQNRLEVKSLTAMSGGGLLTVGGYLSYQHGIYADLSVTGNQVRIRYPAGVSSLADTTLHLQGSQNNLLLSGNVLITRFSVSPDLDFAALATQAGSVATIAPPDAPSNHIRYDVRIQSSPQLNFQNSFAKLAGNVDLRLRGTVASPSLLGRVAITEGSALIAGTRYDLQRGDVTFTNPVRIEPTIDLNATARVEDYDITLGLHGTPQKLGVTYRSDPPLPESDVLALLALGRTENQQRLYTQQQEQSVANPTTDALLGGALNATVSSRVQRLFGASSVKVDPNYIGTLGNSTSRITVEEQLGRNITLTFATDVDTTGQQLLQAEIAINRHVSLLVARDESGVFSMVVKATRRYR